MKNIYKTLIAILIIMFTMPSCMMSTYIFLTEEKKESDDHTSLLSSLGLLPSIGDYFAKMYYLHPYILNASDNNQYIYEAGARDVTQGKEKVILIHGWIPDDRDSVPYLNEYQLKDRILILNWSNFLATNEAKTMFATRDVYAFDYLTSQGIDTNGQRLRAKMDTLFGAETGKVVIFAHSMGGLVSRFALYEGTAPSYIKKVITAGTPFHGSPWASPEYQKDISGLGSIASYLTNTTGGSDLRWDNFDASLIGASNPKLTAINSQTNLDSLFFVMYGNQANTASGSGAQNTAINVSCAVINPDFGNSDCIVPTTSASMNGHTTGVVVGGGDLGAYNHLDIKLEVLSIRQRLLNNL